MLALGQAEGHTSCPSRRYRSLGFAASLVAFAFGACESSNPAAPPPVVDQNPSPAPPPPPPPAPEPEPQPPSVPVGIHVLERGSDFLVLAWEPVEGATGYEGHVFAHGTPSRDRPTLVQVSEPMFRADGLAPDTQWDFFVRAVTETVGGRAVSEWVHESAVWTWGIPRTCTDERREVRRRDRHWRTERSLVLQWDGTPFRVDIIRNFPDWVTDADLWELHAPVAELADQIEDQLGYRIIELGSLIDVPDRARPGWDQNWRRYFTERRLVAEPGEILVFYLNADSPNRSRMGAHICCGTTSYYKRALGPAWTGDDPCCRENTIDRAAIVHELFHLLGFKHAVGQEDLPGVKMSPNSLSRAQRFHAVFEDIDALRCIFPPP